MPLLATVHYGRNYDNAFWDGTQMVFGDGDGVIFEPFTKSLDVIGHELAHGVTEHTAGLLYQGQSGALNESISDVFGVLVKQKALGQSAAQADWLVGAELLNPSVKGRALRDMRNPGTAYDDPRLGKDPQPADMAHYVDTQDDNGGVHINSGIPNRAFVLAADAIGGNAWDAPGAIWYAVLSGDGIKADCDFATFAGLTVAAAATAHGDGSAEQEAVRSAWEQVGVLTEAEVPRQAPARSTAGPSGDRGGRRCDAGGRRPSGAATHRRLRRAWCASGGWLSASSRARRQGLAAPAGGADAPAHRGLDRGHPPRRVHLLRRVRRGGLRRDDPRAAPARGDPLPLRAHPRRRLTHPPRRVPTNRACGTRRRARLATSLWTTRRECERGEWMPTAKPRTTVGIAASEGA